jgi:threonine dehydratase
VNSIPTLEDIIAAAKRIKGKALRTPLIHCRQLSDFTGCEIYLKLECLQPGGAFKYRGATNAISLLSAEARMKGVITASSGNHGIAVALAAKKAGVKALIIVPRNAPSNKVEIIKNAGAKVIRFGDNYDDCEGKAEEMAKEGYYFLHPFNIPQVLAGQGTVGLELNEDAPSDLQAVLVPVGGGGLISGVHLGLRYTRPNVEIIGVEPENCASFSASHAAGELVEIEPKATIAEGLHTKKIGQMAFHILREGAAPVTVTENEILVATRFCHEELKLVVEPSGAVGVAALLSDRYRPIGTSAIILSGSNLDREMLRTLLDHHDQ